MEAVCKVMQLSSYQTKVDIPIGSAYPHAVGVRGEGRVKEVLCLLHWSAACVSVSISGHILLQHSNLTPKPLTV